MSKRTLEHHELLGKMRHWHSEKFTEQSQPEIDVYCVLPPSDKKYITRGWLTPVKKFFWNAVLLYWISWCPCLSYFSKRYQTYTSFSKSLFSTPRYNYHVPLTWKTCIRRIYVFPKTLLENIYAKRFLDRPFLSSCKQYCIIIYM